MKRLKSTPCRRLIWLRRMATAASLLVVASMSACQSSNHSKPDNLSELNLFYPFVFSSSIDPRNVLTVGDSVISDHLFAYHVATTIEKGIRPHFSEVIFNTATQTVSFKVLRDLYYSNGSKLSHVKRCDAIKSSFMGTQHARYKDLVKNVKCSIGGTDIVFDKVPINLRYLLSLPDFSIFDAEKLPVKENSNKNFTTGPYILKSMSSTRVDLDLNVHYPDEFRANKVPKAVINAFDGSRSKQFIQQASPKRQHLIYSPGYSISKADFDRLEEKGYRTHIFSTEWLVHIGFQKAVGLGDRILIGSVIDLNRNSFSEVLELGYPAYSIAPDDRSFGIRKEQYDQITAEIKSKNKTLSKKYKIGTLDEWLKLPIFKAVLDVLKDQLGIETVTFSRKEMSKVYSTEVDMYLSPLGFSPGDPLGHLSYLSKYDPFFANYVSDADILKYAIASSQEEFTSMIYELEKRFVRERVLIPIGHFPGVVAEAKWLKRDEHLANNWGIQAWAYRID